MGRRSPRPERVGIRELRQDLSVYVRRVREEGRAYEVTERGTPVARLVPLRAASKSVIERMIAEGRITRAALRWEEIPPPLPPLRGAALSGLLDAIRDEEDR